MSFVRQSKFRHVFGQGTKNDDCYQGFRADGTGDTNCAVSAKFFALIKQSKIFVVGLDKTGRREELQSAYLDCKNKVLDLAWSPFDDNKLASSEDNGTVNIWTIPEDGLTSVMDTSDWEYNVHKKKVTFLHWHPSADDVLCVGGFSEFISVLDCHNQVELNRIYVGENPTNMAWNHNGSLIALTTKYERKMALQIVNPRNGEVLQTNEQCHLGAKPTKVLFLGDGNLITLGVDRSANRSIKLWNGKNISEELFEMDIGSSSANPNPYYDPDLGILYTFAKGESTVRYYEITKNQIFLLATYSSSASQKGGNFLPKRAVNWNSNEIARFYKLHADKVEPIALTVPRKSDEFQRDIFPPCNSVHPAISSIDWFEGKDAEPDKFDFEEAATGRKGGEPEKPRTLVKKSLPKRDVGGGEFGGKPSPASQPTYQPKSISQASNGIPAGIDLVEMAEDMKKVKATVRKLNKRVNKLTDQLKAAGIIPDEDEEE